MNKVVRLVRFDGRHEFFGDSDRNIKVCDFVCRLLAAYEFKNVGVVDPQDAHIGPPPRSALLDGVGRHVKDPHKADGTRRDTARRTYGVALGAQPRKRHAGAAARLVN
ncbi:hypothetical protein SDC9_144668 [bioreactor metagenome]|uniref:Uncharacterized protein n=1 Tax=bioreactor metagenome TaxID=1076179 RepID=A0A645E7N2_9ZZZZ